MPHDEDDGDEARWRDPDVDRAPICPVCGVTALIAETGLGSDAGFVCENADCEAFGEPVG